MDKININTANKFELQTLPGVGPAISQHIIDYRKSQGKFTQINQLLNVNQIGPKRYAVIKNYVTIDDDDDSSDDEHVLVNINTANSVELQSLPQIGIKISQYIIEHRKLYGKFKSIDQLLDVKQIGTKRYAAIKYYVTV